MAGSSLLYKEVGGWSFVYSAKKVEAVRFLSKKKAEIRKMAE